VRTLGSNRRFVSLQVTNEANVGGAPNVADGSYAGARDALLRGVIAAKQEARKYGFGQIKVGFNWAGLTGGGDRAFWTYLGRHGGRSFTSALDWVGMDVYPGTWGTPLHSRNPDAARRDSWNDSAAHFGDRVPDRTWSHPGDAGHLAALGTRGDRKSAQDLQRDQLLLVRSPRLRLVELELPKPVRAPAR
jgi:hypothetical protein